MFIGEYTHTIDSKRRLSLPAKYRKLLGRSAVVTRGTDENCLFLYSKDEWKKTPQKAIQEKESATNITRKNIRDMNRLFYASASEADIDSSGRILLPVNLSAFAALKDRVVLAGVENRIEIWDEQNWQKYILSASKAAKEISETYDLS